MPYKKLIELIEQRKIMEQKIALAKAKFEESIAMEKALLDDLTVSENKMREEVLLQLKADNLENKKIDNYTITHNIRYTNQIRNLDRLAGAVIDKRDKILALGIEKDKLDNLFETQTVVTDKKLISNIVDSYAKVEGELLPGCERRATEFISVAKI